jgi:hypothetical protein
MKSARIAEAKAIAERTGADSVVIIAFKGDAVAGASYGRTKPKCVAAGKWMDWLIDGMEDGLPRPGEIQTS